MATDKMTLGAKRKFDAGIAELAGIPIGSRHNRLYGLAKLGVWAGLPQKTIEDALFSAGRYVEAERKEIKSTIAKATRECNVVEASTPASLPKAWRKWHKPATRLVIQPSSIFRDLVSVGGEAASFDALKAFSPAQIPESAEGQAIAQLTTLFSGVPGAIWAGEIYEAKKEYAVASLDEWCDRFERFRVVPPYFMANSVTAECVNGSYRNAGTVASFRHAVIEIDTLPIETQAAFWLGVVRKGLLPLRSLVYSGGKSIHGIIRLKDGANEWAKQWNVLARCLASDEDSRYRIDVQCRDATRMSRLAGALRGETGRRQELPWLAHAPGITPGNGRIAPDAPEMAYSAREASSIRPTAQT